MHLAFTADVSSFCGLLCVLHSYSLQLLAVLFRKMEELAVAHTQTRQAITDLEHLLDASSTLALGLEARGLLEAYR